MTLLEPKEIRDANGIDTFERALVYAALMLRASNTAPTNALAGKANPYLNATRIAAILGNVTATGNEPLLKIEIKLPYDSQTALRQGGNFVENIQSYNNSSPTFAYSAVSTKNNIFPLPFPPIWVTTLERYAVWAAINLMGGHVLLNNRIAPPVSVIFLEEDPKEPSVSISATLKLDLFKYLDENNLLGAVIQQVRSGTMGLSYASRSLWQAVAGGSSKVELNYASQSVELWRISGNSDYVISDVKSTSIEKLRVQGKSTSFIAEQNISIASNNSLKMGGSSSSAVIDGNRVEVGKQKTDISGASSSLVGQAPVNPISIYGVDLIAWYRADDVISNAGSISRWSDKSGNGNHAVQTLAAKQPFLVTEGFNQKPVVRFNALDVWLEMPNCLESVWGEASLFIVYNLKDNSQNWNATATGPLNNDAFWGTFPQFGFAGYIGEFRNSRLEGQPANMTVAGNHFVEIISGIGANSYKIYRNKTMLLATNPDWGVTSTPFIGKGGNAARMNGDVAEIFIVKKSATDAQREQSQNYAKDFWNLTF